MAKFDYILSNVSGARTKGTVQAPNKDAAIIKLRKKGKIIISVTENKNQRLYFWQKPHMSFGEKMMFTKHLATMLNVGITITESLQILITQTNKKSTQRMYEEILDMLNSGQTLAKSLKKFDNIFSEIFINMIETGEESGTLEKTLEQLAIQLEKEYDLRKKITGAFMYPGIISGLTLILTVGMIIFIIPKILKVFESFDMKLPLPTRILISVGTFLTEKTFLAIFLFIAIVAFFVIIFRMKALKPFWHGIILRLPVFGKVLVAANISRFARSMNSLLQTGVPVTDTLTITGNMIGNHHYKKVIHEAKDKVEQGGKLGESFAEHEKLFPIMAVKMMYIGEKSGSLETTTQRLAELYEKEVNNLTKNLSILLEPILLILMGVLLGGIALSIILPIYQLPNLIKK